MLGIKKLMFESPLNFRVLGTALSNDELFIALESIIIVDTVGTVPTDRNQED